MPPSSLIRPRLSAANLRHDSNPPTPTTPHGFRAQINHLIPRHSYFRARVHIHQLDSVPFVNGQFAVRWKFKHVHSLPSTRAGLLGIVKTRSRGPDKRLPGLPKDDPSLDATSSPSPNPSVPSLIVSSNSTDSSSSNDTTRISTTSSNSHPATIPFVTLPSSAPHNTHSELPVSSLLSTAPTNLSSATLHIHLPSARVCASSSPTPTSLNSSLSTATTVTVSTSDTTSANPPTPTRGHTSYNHLKEHSVQWNQTLSTVVRLDVDRDNGYIFPCPFKLVIMQRPSDGDHNSTTGNTPEVHRLGALYLNLSEYVGHGSVERRYLLRESKTNATLKLTVELEYLSGQRDYIPPPLPKGEILNGLSGYLEGELSKSTLTGHHHRHGHRPPNHGIDLYGPYSNQEELELDLFGTRCPKTSPSIPSSNPSRSRLACTGAEPGQHLVEDLGSDLEDDNRILHDQIVDSPTIQTTTPIKATFFDVERLPMAYGTKTTETLIEAIFNPVKTNEERCESPFTIFVPPPIPTMNPIHPINDTPDYSSNPNSRRQTIAAVEVASVYSLESSSTSSGSTHSRQSGALSRSVHSQMSQTSQGSARSGIGERGVSERTSGGKVKDWWKKTVGSSRPGTPAGVPT